MTITPEQERELLDGATAKPGESWEDFDMDEIHGSAVDLAETIAGMEWEWGVDANGNSLFPVNEEFHPSGEYFTECRADAEGVRDRMAKLNPHVHYRIVRRIVGPVEVVVG